MPRKRITARVVLPDGHGRYLALLEGDRPRAVSFPGGRVDRGETPARAAARELFEETGLVARKLVPFCVVVESKRESVMFFAQAVSGALRASHEGIPVWATPRDFVAGDYGNFAKAVFRELAKISA